MSIFKDSEIYVTEELLIPNGSIFLNNVKFLNNLSSPVPVYNGKKLNFVNINNVIFKNGATFENIICKTNLNFKSNNKIIFKNCSLELNDEANIDYDINIIDSEIKNIQNSSIYFVNSNSKLQNIKLTCDKLSLDKLSDLILINNGSYPNINCNEIIINNNSSIENYGYKISTNKLSLLDGIINNNYNKFTNLDYDPSKFSPEEIGLFSTLMYSIIEYKKGKIINHEGCFIITNSDNNNFIENKGYLLNFEPDKIKINSLNNSKSEINNKIEEDLYIRQSANDQSPSKSKIFFGLILLIIIICFVLLFAMKKKKIKFLN